MTDRLKDYAEAAVMVLFVLAMFAAFFVPAVVGGILYGGGGALLGLFGTLALCGIGAIFLSALKHVRNNGRDLFR